MWSICLIVGSEIFGVLFEHGTEAVFSIHRESKHILTANSKLENLVGRSSTSLIGRPAIEMFLQDERVRDWSEQIVTRAGLHEEVALKSLDNYPIYVSLTVAHIEHSRQGSVAACIARDTTERRLLERELIAKHAALYSAHAELEDAFRQLGETQKSLEQRNKELATLGGQLARAAHRAAIGEFSAGIAHSMNNPIGAALSAISQIEKQVNRSSDKQLSEQLERFLRRGKHALSRMESIVASVRRAHKSGDIQVEAKQLCIADEVDIVAMLFEDRFSDIEFVKKCHPEASAWVPSEAFHHVVSNIVDNAIKAMLGGGTLTIETSQRGDNTVLTISDSGKGVPKDFEHLLFEPFASARSDGTGLGLCMAQRLARQWGGDVHLVSADQGACFEITMPSKERI